MGIWFCPINIELIWSESGDISFLSKSWLARGLVLFVRIVNCFGRLYVWMYGPGAPKRSVFTRGFPVRVLPHTKEQKASPNGLQEYVFMEVLEGSRFEVFEVHPSVHPSMHTLDIYRGFRKRSIFTVVFENVQFFRYVKPYLLDIYRRFWNIPGKIGGKKVVTSKRFLYVRPLFHRYIQQTSINTFPCNN